MRTVFAVLRSCWLWAKWHAYWRWVSEPNPFAPSPVFEAPATPDSTTQQCMICEQAIEPGVEFLLAAYGPVHRNGHCEHQSYSASRISTPNEEKVAR